MAPLRIGLTMPEVPEPPVMLPEVTFSSHLATASGMDFSVPGEGAAGAGEFHTVRGSPFSPAPSLG